MKIGLEDKIHVMKGEKRSTLTPSTGYSSSRVEYHPNAGGHSRVIYSSTNSLRETERMDDSFGNMLAAREKFLKLLQKQR